MELGIGTAYSSSIQPWNNSTDNQNTRIGQEEKECQTCKNRKYVDGSNEDDVSFKTPGHISPEASIGQVKAHENQHVSNAIAEGNKPDKELVSSTVTIKMATCPECGKSYAAGGVTSTVMKTSKPVYNNTPYDKGRQIVDASIMAGARIDAHA